MATIFEKLAQTIGTKTTTPMTITEEKVPVISRLTQETVKLPITAPARTTAAILLPFKKQPALIPETPTEKFLYGEEKVLSIGETYKKISGVLQKYTTSPTAAGITAIPLTIAGAVIDLSPLGFEKKAGEKAVKELVEKYGEDITKKIIAKGSKNLVETAIKEGGEEIVKKYVPEFTDISKVISKETKEVLPKAEKGLKWKERGFITSVKEEIPELKEKVAGQYVPRSTDRLAIRAKNQIKDDINVAERMVKTQTDDDAVATGIELIKHYSDNASTVADEATKNVLYDKAAETAHILAKNLTEQGRAVQAATILGRLTPEGQLRFAAKEINKYNEGIIKKGFGKTIPSLTADDSKYILGESKRISQMSDGVGKAQEFKKLQDWIADKIPSPFYKKLINIWKAGLLTGIKTSGLNIFSNLFHGISEVAKDIPAVGIDSVLSLFTKQRTLGFTTKGIKEGTKEGFEKGWRYLKTGFDERNIAIKLDYRQVNFGQSKIAKGLQNYEQAIFRILGAEDQPFYYGAKARALYSQAIAQAKNKGLEGKEFTNFVENLVKNPTDDMLKIAVNDAEISVFQNKTALGYVAKTIQKIPGGEFVIPFGRTPSAVATQLVNYSPIGFVKTIVENIGKGKFNQRELSQGIGRAVVGTGVFLAGIELYKQKKIALEYPKPERERKLWERQGKTPNSILIGEKYNQASVLGPAGMMLIVGGQFQRALEKTGSQTQALSEAIIGASKTLQDQTFLKGLNQVLEALNNPERFGEGYISGTLASFIPTLISDISQTGDIYQRRTQGIISKAKARIPGIRETLEPKIDIAGMPVERGGNIVETLIAPWRPSKRKEDTVSAELQRLWDKGQEVSPAQLGSYFGYKSLTPFQNTQLWSKTGQILYEKLANVINSRQYNQLDDEGKGKIIKNFTQEAGENGRAIIVMDIIQGLKGEELKNKLSELKKDKVITQSVYDKILEYE